MKPEITAIETAGANIFLYNEEKTPGIPGFKKETYVFGSFLNTCRKLKPPLIRLWANTKQQTEIEGTRSPKHSPANRS